MRDHQPIHFEFNERKATAAAALLLKHEGSSLPYLRLIKLLYLAERESLHRFGRPICGDTYVAMKYGPVLSRVFNLIRADSLPRSSWWGGHIARSGRYDVIVKQDPGRGALSDEEVEILEEAARIYRSLDQWRLCDLTHTFPEWKDPGDSSFPIQPEDILGALGKSEEEIEEIRQEALEARHFNSIFGNPD